MSKDFAALARAQPLLLAERERRLHYKFRRYFPDCQPGCKPDSPRRADHVGLCRRLYVKHCALMAAGAIYPERLFLKANRVGGTEAAAYELTCHLTGLYPHWWRGRRFAEPGEWWVAGDTGKTTRDICQVALMGPLKRPMTGMLPAHLVNDWSPKAGLPDGMETIWVQHVERDHGAPALSMVQLKSYDQKREAFQGTTKQGVWLDEEPPEDIVEECILRTMTSQGLLLLTFTPLQGLTPYVQQYLENSDMYIAEGVMAPTKEAFWKGHDPV